jgi:hypothetical protein
MAKSAVSKSGSVFGASGGRWIAGISVVAGTFLLGYMLSPGLRADVGGLVSLAAFLGEGYATGVKNFVLSFGVFSPIAYFFAMVAQVFRLGRPAPVPRSRRGCRRGTQRRRAYRVAGFRIPGSGSGRWRVTRPGCGA